MLKRTFILVTFLFIGYVNGIYAQEIHEHDEEHHENELGVANSVVYFMNEEEFSYGLHLHYVRTISHSKFGIGAGLERIFDEHEHLTIGLVASYRPIHELSLIVSPGVGFEGGHSERHFALHLESSYEFKLGIFHLGPLLEAAFDPEDTHLSLGLHVGIGF